MLRYRYILKTDKKVLCAFTEKTVYTGAMRENIYYHLIKRCRRLLWNKPQKLLLLPLIRKMWPYTLIGYVNLCQLHDATKSAVKNNIDGAFIEAGCWNGGAGVLMAYTAKKLGSPRATWLFDSFEGLPQFGKFDEEKARIKKRAIRHDIGEATGIFKAEEEHVRHLSRKMGVTEQVEIVPGWFKDTVPKVKDRIGKIALLHLDADLYESTKFMLKELYDSVTPGGIVIIDDYGAWKGCNRAIYEFFVERGIDQPIYHYPYRGRAYFIK